MKSHAVGIYYFGMTADSSKVKSTFALFYEIFHLATPTVKLDDLIRFHIHVCNNKGVHIRYGTGDMGRCPSALQRCTYEYSEATYLILNDRTREAQCKRGV